MLTVTRKLHASFQLKVKTFDTQK